MELKKEQIPYSLLAAHLANELSFSQKEVLNTWVNKSPNNKTILSELKIIWDYKDFNTEKALKSLRKLS